MGARRLAHVCVPAVWCRALASRRARGSDSSSSCGSARRASRCHPPSPNSTTTCAGYVGTCAGAYLAITAECCDRALPNTTYCGGKTGCYPDDWALGFVNIASANPWARGHGPVDVTFTDAAVDALQLPESYRGRNVSIMYWQGPILDKV